MKDETIGKKFHRLTILACAPSANRSKMVVCICDCGKEVIRHASNVISGKTKSCGCLHMEISHSRVAILKSPYNIGEKYPQVTEARLNSRGITRDLLIDMYSTHSLAELGIYFNRHPSAVSRWFTVLGIPKRNKGASLPRLNQVDISIQPKENRDIVGVGSPSKRSPMQSYRRSSKDPSVKQDSSYNEYMTYARPSDIPESGGTDE